MPPKANIGEDLLQPAICPFLAGSFGSIIVGVSIITEDTEMTHETNHDPDSIEAERDDDDPATIFARLFLEQYQYNKRLREKRSQEDTFRQ